MFQWIQLLVGRKSLFAPKVIGKPNIDTQAILSRKKEFVCPKSNEWNGTLGTI